MNRRDFLGTGLALAASGATASCGSPSSEAPTRGSGGDGRTGRDAAHGPSNPPTSSMPSSSRTPTTFVAHGAPPLLDDAGWMAELAAWGQSLARPKAILVVSAHWEARPVTLGATRPLPLVYDFYGFPKRFYELRYDAPGAPELAQSIEQRLGPSRVARDEARGLDHGVYIPLLAMFPSADVPVLQLSLPTLEARALLDLGRELAPLRDEGVLVMGSGFITHNLRSLGRHPNGPPSWALDFDSWIADAIARHDYDALATYAERAPGVRESLPTHEHFAPLLVAVGAAMGEPVRTAIDGWAFGSFSKRSLTLGA
jgi:4,5-DOPA dioxygenase extradiol